MVRLRQSFQTAICGGHWSFMGDETYEMSRSNCILMALAPVVLSWLNEIFKQKTAPCSMPRKP
jgi:hypothetical protein